jgi:hypothetical protein
VHAVEPGREKDRMQDFAYFDDVLELLATLSRRFTAS